MEFIPENEILKAVVIIAVFWIGSYAVTFLLGFVSRVTVKTKTNLDDKIINAIKLPIRYLFILLGLFFGLKGFDLNWTIKSKEFGFTDIFFIIIILLAGFTISRILKTIFSWYTQTERGSKSSQTMFLFVRKVIAIFIYLIALLIIFGQLGIQVGPLLAGFGIAGLAIALGLQSTLENLFSALFLVMDKSINVGDWIQLDDGTKAYIEDISWRSVRIRTIGGNTVIVPNSVFVGQKISSYDYGSPSFYTSVEAGVAYDTDLEKAEYVAAQAAARVIKDENIKQLENNPIVRYKELADSAINLIVILKVDNVLDEGRVKHALIKELVKQFRENKIEIPFPQRVVEIKNNIN